MVRTRLNVWGLVLVFVQAVMCSALCCVCCEWMTCLPAATSQLDATPQALVGWQGMKWCPQHVCSTVTVHTTNEQCMVPYYVRKYIFTNLQQWLALSWPPSRRPCPLPGQRTERLPTLLLPHLRLHSGSSTRSWIIPTSLGVAHYFLSTSLSSHEVFKPLWRSNSSCRDATNDSTSR